ncbi:MAG TPA: hypothetical protein VIH17_07575 [Candidatus Acidoferrales bacterium]
MLELDQEIVFDPSAADMFEQIPEKLGVVALFSEEDMRADPFLGKTTNLRRRLMRLLDPEATLSKRLRLRDFTKIIRYRVTASAFESSVVLYEQARRFFPERYRDFLRLRPPAMLKVNLKSEYPRCYVTRRIADPSTGPGRADESFYFGLFLSRLAAQKFADQFLDFFKMRRCQIKIRRDPTFPGCIYSDMKMCLAPCFAGCTKAEYDVEVSRVTHFLKTRGQSLLEELSGERKAASTATHFESAAAIHKRIEKLEGILRGGTELERPLEDLNAIVVQKSVEEGFVILYPVERGRLGEAIPFRVCEQSDRPVSLEQRLRQALPNGQGRTANLENGTQPQPAAPQGEPFESPRRAQGKQDTPFTGRDLSEHLWLLARWFHSKPREGEILFEERGEISWRKLANACSRVIKAPQNLF